MEVIEVREDPGRPNGAVLRIDGYEHQVTVTSPFDTDQLQELDWYFEQHLRFPFIDQVRARRAGESIKSYGEALFQQLFASEGAREAYGDLKPRAYPDRLAIAVIGSPAFQGLHWEALKDPRLPRPFALDVPIMRRRTASAPPLEAIAANSPTLNVLVLTARPHGAYDVGYRTITRPLVDMLRQAQLRVDVDFVRPGTWQALVERLEAATRDHGAGHYHAIHFDLHGGLLSYDEFVKRQEAPGPADRVTMRSRWGRGEIDPYEGVKAFLCFQPAKDDPSGLGEAGELAGLLLKHKIPIAILNACQSSKQVGAEESSLAARLLEAGMQSVLGMAWSVTVSAAERLIPKLYGDLFAGRPLGTAVLAGRRELAADKARRAAFNETIALEDWLLPVAYQNREPRLAFREFTREETDRWYTEEAGRSPDPVTEYGFFGRDLDVLRIETALLTRRNLLLVQGMGGSGKTTLLRHLAHWWELTGLTERSFYFGWDVRAWTRTQIMRALAPHVLPADAARAFDTMSEAAQQQAVAAALRGRRHLLILDNLESVTAAPLAIPHSLDANRREELRSFLAALAGGQTLVLMGSRGDETWLARDTFAGNVYQLEGLDPEAASDLANAVLQRAGAQGRREESAFKELMALLTGYPLALQVVLPHLAAKTTATVLDELRRGLAEADDAPGPDPALARTRSLIACIEYSHGHLDPDAQALLTCFAPFTGLINTAGLLESYRKALAEEPALAGLPLDQLSDVLERARGLGLLQRDSRIRSLLRPQPALSWFLTGRLEAANQAERRQSIHRAFRRYYEVFAAYLYRLQISENPESRQAAQVAVEQEYANLGTALGFALDQQASILHLYAVLSEHLDGLQDHRRGRELGELVLEKAKQLLPDALTGRRGVEIAGVIDTIARRQLTVGELESARASYESELALLDGLQIDDDLQRFEPQLTGRTRAIIFHQFGIIAQGQRRFAEAEDAYKKALEIKLALDDRRGAAETYYQLGLLALVQCRFGEAEDALKMALEISIAIDDRLYVADAYQSLGTAALEQDRFEEAEDAYNKALVIYAAFDRSHEQAITYNQLGRVADQQRRFAEAEDADRKALEIWLALNDHRHAATAYHNIGMVARHQQRFAEAENAYKKALEIYVTFDNRYEQASTYQQLGVLAQVQRRFSEAEDAYKKALEIKLAFDDRRGAAATYYQLGVVALLQRRFAEAEDTFKKALEIFIEIDDRLPVADAYQSLGTAALEQDRFPEAEDAYKKALEIKLAFDDRRGAAESYHQLGVVALLQRRFAEAEDAFKKALEIFFALEDEHRVAFVLDSIAHLWSIIGAPSIPSTVAAILGLEIERAKELLRAAAKAAPPLHGTHPDPQRSPDSATESVETHDRRISISFRIIGAVRTTLANGISMRIKGAAAWVKRQVHKLFWARPRTDANRSNAALTIDSIIPILALQISHSDRATALRKAQAFAGLWPKDRAVPVELGDVFWKYGEYHCAIEMYEMGVARGFHTDDKFYNRAGERETALDMESAIRLHKLQIESGGEEARCLGNLAADLVETGKAKEAYPYASRACQLAPTNLTNLSILAGVLSSLGRPNDAIRLYKEVASKAHVKNDKALYQIALNNIETIRAQIGERAIN